MNSTVILASLLSCIWLSWHITRRFLLFAMEQRLLDIPNERSSHSRITPRGGGISFVLLFLVATVLLNVMHALSIRSGAAILTGAAVALVGYIDDRQGVSIRARLFVQLTSTAVTLYLIFGNPFLRFHHSFVITAAASAAALILYTWLINAMNFMDGIDGLAASEAVCVASFCSLAIIVHHGPTHVAFLFGVLACATFGFLFWNWPGAQVFMGDAGSGFLGFSIGALSLLAVARHELSVWSAPIMLGVFITDATMTLYNRISRNERWYKPHRLHAFQHAADAFGHKAVTTAVIMINIFWLAPLAIAAETHPTVGFPLTVFAWLPLAALCYLFHAGEVLRPDGIPRWRTLALIMNIVPQHIASQIAALAYGFEHRRVSFIRASMITGICITSTYGAIAPQGLHFLSTTPPPLLVFLGIFSVTQIAALFSFGLHRSHWHLVSLTEIPDIVGMCVVASLAGLAAGALVSPDIPERIPAADFVTQTLMVMTLLILAHLAASALSKDGHPHRDILPTRRVLVYGANAAGLEIASNLRRLGSNYRVVGFIDPRPFLKGTQMAGGTVLGSDTEICKLVDTYKIDQVLVSSSSTTSLSGKTFLQHCQKASVHLLILPSIEYALDVPSEVKPVAASA